MSENVYLVVEYGSDSYETKRVYLDQAEADAFVEAANAAGSYYEVEEMHVGPPDVPYDGPIWIGTWTTRRKLVGEKQLILVSENGFVTVVPSATPTGMGSYRYQEMFSSGAGWWDTIHNRPPDYEEPPVWIDSFYYRQEWHTGDDPGPATTTERQTSTHIEVRGSSKDDVEALLKSEALQAKQVGEAL